MRFDEQPDYYEILGVTRSATADEITRGYRKAMRAVHPDASGTSGLFRLVKTAYETLKDPKARAAYDGRHADPGRRPPPGPPPAPPPRPPKPPPKSPPKPPPSWDPPPWDPPGPKKPPKQDPPRKERHQEPPRQEPRARPRPSSEPSAPPWPYDDGAELEPVPRGEAPVRIRPRFGAHWRPILAMAGCALVCAAAVLVCWPAQTPFELSLLLFLPILATPVISAQADPRWRGWLWTGLPTFLAGCAALIALAADPDEFWPLCIALAGLCLAGTALITVPWILRRGRVLDRLVDREALKYQIFNVAASGVTDPVARQTVLLSAAHVEGLHRLTGTLIVHALNAPRPPRLHPCRVDHAVLRDNRLALIMARSRLMAGVEDMTNAVQGFRTVLGRHVLIRGFISLDLPDVSYGPVHDLFVGSPSEVNEQVALWLGEAEPVIRRRTFAALLPHIEH